MTKRQSGVRQLTAATSMLVGLVSASVAHALEVQAEVSDLGGFFHYEFQVLNDDPIPDLLLVSIDDAPLGDPLIDGSLTAPAGFLASYDGGLGIVDLIADVVGFFPVGLTEGFSFDSLVAPTSAFTSYQTLDGVGNVLVGSVDSQLVARVAAPTTLTLMILGLGLGVLGSRSGSLFPRSLDNQLTMQEEV